MESDKTLQDILTVVCNEMSVTEKDLRAERSKSNIKLYIAKLICTHLLKKRTPSLNREILKVLGYKNRKTINYNLDAMKKAIDTADELVLTHLNNIEAVLNGGQAGRLYKMDELPTLHIFITGDKIHEVDTAAKLQQSGVFPFVIRTNNKLFNGYGVDSKGVYVGQSEQEYKIAVM